MQNNLDILKNKANSLNMSSAKNNKEIKENTNKEMERNAEKIRTNIFGKGRELHNALMSDSGVERVRAISEIARMIFGGS